MKTLISLTVALFISLGAFAQNGGKTPVAPGSKAAPKKAVTAKSTTATPVVKTESPK